VGAPCDASTRGLLTRVSILAGQLRYVGKETDRRWTEGEDLSLLTFKLIEYVPPGKVAASAALRKEIVKRGVRESMRATGLSQHTIEAIGRGKSVQRTTLQRLGAVLATQDTQTGLAEPRRGSFAVSRKRTSRTCYNPRILLR
jgi:hypothetical protein